MRFTVNIVSQRAVVALIGRYIFFPFFQKKKKKKKKKRYLF